MKMFIEFWEKIKYIIKNNFIKIYYVGSWINEPQEKKSFCDSRTLGFTACFAWYAKGMSGIQVILYTV